MSIKKEENDIYIIPPNFIESGTVFGGTIKLSNAAEALLFSLLIGFPVFHLPIPLTTKIIIACLTVLPVALFAIIGIGGESLSSFAFNFLIYLKKRRIVGLQPETDEEPAPEKAKRTAKKKSVKKAKPKKEDFAEEFGQRKELEQTKIQKEAAANKPGKKGLARNTKAIEPEAEMINSSAVYLPIRRVANGIIYTKDNRYIKIIEVIPINFLLRSAREQRNIIYSFVSYLKISPVKLQFKVLTRKADINRHLEAIREEMKLENDERCLALQKDYETLIRRIGSKEAITRRFFIAFEYEPITSNRGSDENDAIAALTTAVRTAKTYLQQCGNELVMHDNEDEMATEVIDYTHGNYVVMDGIYHTYLLISSSGNRTQVYARWISLLVNAGEGIDVDIFFDRQPKDHIQQKLGQQLRINRSKIKDTSDTNSDFNDLDSAIQSGYFLKEGLASNEDFYYMNVLLTITADSLEELEWRTNEMKKLMLSQDMEAVSCHFRQEQALLSALPIVSLEKKLFERSKRNILTSSVASCYPFTSFEMCDDNGILLGVNKHNNSLIIVDIFNSRTFKNANMAILGTSGAGKTFIMQLMALRMRRKNIQVFIIAPLKGHEFHRACSNIGGEFIQISPASKNCINIMEIRKVDSSTNDILDGPQTEKSELAAKIQRLHIFFSLLIPDMNHEERQLLVESLFQTYNRKGITHNNESLIDPMYPSSYKEMPILEDVFNILKDNPDTRRLANIMNRLVHGSASTFNQQTSVNLDNKYTVLDISELTGDLLTVGMFVALDFVWDQQRKTEPWKKPFLLMRPGSLLVLPPTVLQLSLCLRSLILSEVMVVQQSLLLRISTTSLL